MVGEDVFGFAEEWAAPNRLQKPVAHEVLEMFAATSAFMFVARVGGRTCGKAPRALLASWEMVRFLRYFGLRVLEALRLAPAACRRYGRR